MADQQTELCIVGGGPAGMVAGLLFARAGVRTTVLEKHEIGSRLPRMLAAKQMKVVYFDAHNDTPYGSAMEAMDLARAAGARSIALLTEPVVR